MDIPLPVIHFLHLHLQIHESGLCRVAGGNPASAAHQWLVHDHEQGLLANSVEFQALFKPPAS